MSINLETIHNEMLDAIDDRYQKTPGFPAYDFTRAFALALLSLDEDIDIAEAHLNVENLSGIELDTFITQHRGVYRRDATCAEATLRIVSGSDSIDIQIGDLFSTESGVEFEVVEDGTYSVGDTFNVQAVAGGESGNVAANTITFMPVTISGLGSVTNDAAATGGYDQETDDEYRNRYYESLLNPSNGSNAAAYLAWATEISGVGRAKVFPLANGAGTVEVCITSSSMLAPNASLVEAVQAHIDPHENGDGSGAAPMGAVCTVTGATEKTINVAASLTLEEGVSDVTAAVTAALTAYFRSVAFVSLYVSYAQVGNAILDVDGVADYANLTINSGSTSITLTAREVPKLGTVTLTIAEGE